MKHLKTFENVENFKIGDIVAFDKERTSKWYLAPIFKIIDISMGGSIYITNYDDSKEDNKWVNSNLLRFATPEEIEKWNLTIQTDKYNL